MKIWFVVLLALGLSSAVVSAAESGTVTGQMVVNGKVVKLTHVYASAMPGRSDKKKVFSDMGNGVTFQDDVTFSAPVEP